MHFILEMRAAPLTTTATNSPTAVAMSSHAPSMPSNVLFSGLRAKLPSAVAYKNRQRQRRWGVVGCGRIELIMLIVRKIDVGDRLC